MTARSVAYLLVALLLGSLAAEAQQVKLRVTSQLPGTHHIVKGLVQFKDEVAQRTNNAIAIEVIDTVIKDDQVLGALSSGAIEMGSLTADVLIDKVPAVSILQQPFLFNFYAIVEAVADPDREMRPLLDQAILEATGNRVLMWVPFGTTGIVSKQRPLLSPSDISKKKVRVLGKTLAAFIEQCGGIPAIIPAADQAAAMQEGRVDMVMTGITAVTARNLWKVGDTMTRTEHATSEVLVLIKEPIWQRLSENHKAVIKEVGRKVERKLREQIAQIESDDFRVVREKGMKVYELTPDQVAEWRACSAPVLDEFMASSGELAHQLMLAYGTLRTEPCCSTGPGGEFTRR
jgi:C4-dicarboxylate-binding protein DctP